MKSVALVAAAALIALSLAGPGAAYPPADCAFYEAAYGAVAPLLAEARPRGKTSAFATMTLDRAHDPQYGRPQGLAGKIGPIAELAGCPALTARIAAEGAPIRFGRPPVLRQVDGPTVEAFSRPVVRGGVTHLTYFLGREAGVDLELRQGADGGWTVEKAVPWETIVLT